MRWLLLLLRGRQSHSVVLSAKAIIGRATSAKAAVVASKDGGGDHEKEEDPPNEEDG